MSGTTSDLDLTPRDFERARRLLKERAGIELASNRQSLVVARLLRRLKGLGLDSFNEYFDLVERDPEEAGQFVSALTTNVTSFFRERHHFELLASIAAETARAEPLSIWSAACSTGQEPWSIAMTLQASPPRTSWKLLATDIDAEVLGKAREGVYSAEEVASIPVNVREAAFSPDQSGAFFRVRNSLRANTYFAQLNLLDPWPMKKPFDVVLCRNVLIYFSPETRADIVRRLANQLRVGGVLMLGHSEAALGAIPTLSPIGKTAFRRVANPRAS
jgi:chemotaxis protein methyltransferase CheR